ncbi:hypothetical protein ORG37_07400 [Rahnella perminowiae]|uniref:hypothetical protein n=1 Tax=Rahnella perminowiae TaxID=2816244 RepID=UPI00224BA005|nr:hypothetical protein [Rahnella perminowiae]MCX2942924.1 hypothetical protein [Rahnella perminowiae]
MIDSDNKFTLGDITLDDYHVALRMCDIAACEANAVSQASAQRYVKPYIGWSNAIFTRLCIHTNLLMSSAPLSRWRKSEFECWDYSSVAPHCRAILEGEILFHYLSQKPSSEEEWLTKLKIMHLNDCCRRVKLLENSTNSDGYDYFVGERDRLIADLESNSYFLSLDKTVQKKSLLGKLMTIQSRDELLNEMGFDKDVFNKNFDHLSNFTHILPYSYYSMETNGRSTGVMNETDRGFICLALINVAEVMKRCTDKMVDFFPDVQSKRKGLKSKFNMGPKPR